MNTKVANPPRWSTSSFGANAETSDKELSALGAHLDVCRALRGPWFAARCLAETLNRFMAARFVTTLIGASVLLAVVAVTVAQ